MSFNQKEKFHFTKEQRNKFLDHVDDFLSQQVAAIINSYGYDISLFEQIMRECKWVLSFKTVIYESWQNMKETLRSMNVTGKKLRGQTRKKEYNDDATKSEKAVTEPQAESKVSDSTSTEKSISEQVKEKSDSEITKAEPKPIKMGKPKAQKPKVEVDQDGRVKKNW